MPKLFENKVVYDFPPTHTINYLHRKYPNPYATHVVSVDTVSREIDPETGIMRSERIVGVKQGAPAWITKLFALPPVAFVREIIFVDPSVPKATMMSQNLNLAQYVSCLEHITYSPHFPAPPPPQSNSRRGLRRSKTPDPPAPVAPPSTEQDDPSKAPFTLFHQRAILSSGFPTRLVARRIEKASYDRFAANADIGKQGFEWVLQGGQSQGSGYWKDNKPV